MSILYSYAIEPLDKVQELGLAEKAAGGDKQARETLIRANIRYALSYAKTFYGHGLSNEDIDEEAIIGLIKAIDNFDYKRGYKIITYAKMYIMNEIMHASNYSGYVPPCTDLEEQTESNYEAPEAAAIYEVLSQSLHSKLPRLDPLERQVINMVYGLGQYKKPYSMAEIGKKLGRSKQYIFYIKERAISKLKDSMEEESLAA